MCDIFKYELVDGWLHSYDALKSSTKYSTILCAH